MLFSVPRREETSLELPHGAAYLRKYLNFSDLLSNERPGRDYEIRHRDGLSRVLILAPHGGAIEPGTTEIAAALAGSEHHYYSFLGLRQSGNQGLRIPSTVFDEPLALPMAAISERIGPAARAVSQPGFSLPEGEIGLFQAFFSIWRRPQTPWHSFIPSASGHRSQGCSSPFQGSLPENPQYYT